MNFFYTIAGQQGFKQDVENASKLSFPQKLWRRTQNK